MSAPPFAPPRLLRNAHLQTLFAAWPARRAAPEGSSHEPLTIPLGGGEALHALGLFCRGDRPRPAALLLHGVGGSIGSAYMIRAEAAVARAGFHSVSLDLRGAGEGASLSRSLYHAGLTSDVDAAIGALSADPRVGPILLVGFSLGGQIALLTASRWGSSPPPRLARLVAVCPPFDLDTASKLIERPRSYPYKAYVLRSLVAGALALKARAPGSVAASAAELRALRSVRAYDQLVIAPMHGFASAVDYYQKVSCGPRLGEVGVPSLVLAAEDDPMVPAHTLRPFLGRLSPRVELVWTPHGGHIGFVDRLPDGLVETWANARIVAALRELG